MTGVQTCALPICGRSKAEAIMATKSLLQDGYLLLDEEAADAILELLASKG